MPWACAVAHSPKSDGSTPSATDVAGGTRGIGHSREGQPRNGEGERWQNSREANNAGEGSQGTSEAGGMHEAEEEVEQGLSRTAHHGLQVFGTLVLLLVAVLLVYARHHIDAGAWGLALQYAISLPRQIMWLARQMAELEVEFVAVERVVEYGRLPAEGTEAAAGLHLPESPLDAACDSASASTATSSPTSPPASSAADTACGPSVLGAALTAPHLEAGVIPALEMQVRVARGSRQWKRTGRERAGAKSREVVGRAPAPAVSAKGGMGGLAQLQQQETEDLRHGLD